MYLNILPKLSGARLGSTVTVLLFCAILWFLPLFFIDGMVEAQPMVFRNDMVLFSITSLLSRVLGFVLMVGLFFYVTRFAEQLQVVPVRSMMPLFVGVFLMSCVNFLQFFSGDMIAFVLFVLAVSELLRMYYHNELVSAAFNIFFLLFLAGLFVYQYFLLMPLFLLGIVILRSFTFRIFLASLVGVIAPMSVLTAVCYLTDSMEVLGYLWHVPALFHFEHIELLSRLDVVYGVFLLLISTFAIVSYLMKSYSYKLNVRLNFVFIHWSFWLTSLVMALFLEQFEVLLYLPLFFTSLLLSLYFSTNSGKLSSIVFLIFVVFSLLYRLFTMFGL